MRAAGSSETPSEGTILYHEPAPQQGLTKRRTSPWTQLVIMDEALADEGPVRSFSGTVAGVEKGRPIDDGLVGRHFQTIGKANTRVLNRERFRALWRELDDAGLFRLPPYREQERPRDEPYFLLKTGDREWTFTRPAYVDTPDRNDPQVEQLRIWNTAKLAFVDFLNRSE